MTVLDICTYCYDVFKLHVNLNHHRMNVTFSINVTYMLCRLFMFTVIILFEPEFCLSENKSAGQLCNNCTSDQRLCFRNTHNTIIIPPLFLPKISVCGCTGLFVSDLIGNPEDRFSDNGTLFVCCVEFHNTWNSDDIISLLAGQNIL